MEGTELEDLASLETGNNMIDAFFKFLGTSLIATLWIISMALAVLLFFIVDAVSSLWSGDKVSLLKKRLSPPKD